MGWVGALLGMGGGFFVVRAVVYLLRVPGKVVMGKSLVLVVAQCCPVL